MRDAAPVSHPPSSAPPNPGDPGPRHPFRGAEQALSITPPGRREDVNLRELKLAAKAKEDFSPDGLRSVFRLLDEDGSKELSPAEVKNGLIKLGFPVGPPAKRAPCARFPSHPAEETSASLPSTAVRSAAAASPLPTRHRRAPISSLRN